MAVERSRSPKAAILAALSLCGQVLFAVGAVQALIRSRHLVGGVSDSVLWVSIASMAVALVAGGGIALWEAREAATPVRTIAVIWLAAALALFFACR